MKQLDPHEPIITISNAKSSIANDTTGQLQFLENEDGVFFCRRYNKNRVEIFAKVVNEDEKTPYEMSVS